MARELTETGVDVLPAPFALSRASLVDLVMLTVLGGRERTLTEYEDLLRRAGFDLEKVEDQVGPMNLIEARAV